MPPILWGRSNLMQIGGIFGVRFFSVDEKPLLSASFPNIGGFDWWVDFWWRKKHLPMLPLRWLWTYLVTPPPEKCDFWNWFWLILVGFLHTFPKGLLQPHKKLRTERNWWFLHEKSTSYVRNWIFLKATACNMSFWRSRGGSGSFGTFSF